MAADVLVAQGRMDLYIPPGTVQSRHQRPKESSVPTQTYVFLRSVAPFNMV